MIAEQLTVVGPHWSLYDYKEDQWVSLLSWHHFNMYFFYGLMGVSQVLCFIFTSIPSSLPTLMFANGFFVEGKYIYNINNLVFDVTLVNISTICFMVTWIP